MTPSYRTQSDVGGAGADTAVPTATRHERRRELDLLRMLVVVGLVFFHSARIFDTGDFYVKNDPTSEGVDVAVAFAATWGMPLLFVIAGFGMWYSLGSRTPVGFAGERIRRLLVPLVFGVLVIVPPQVWTELRGRPTYDESYIDFLARYFDVEIDLSQFPFLIMPDPTTDLFEYGHLWFVVILFAYSLLLVPVVSFLRGGAGSRRLTRLASAADRPGVLVVSVVPFVALEAVLGSEEHFAAWNRHTYAVFILYGFVLASDRRFGRALIRWRKHALAFAATTFVAAGGLFATMSDTADPFVDRDPASYAVRALKGASGWMWIVAILGFASSAVTAERSNRPPRSSASLMDRIADYTSDAVMPIYVLHQTVIVLIGFYIVDWPLATGLKYFAVSLLSLMIIVAIYDIAVRRTVVTRFLFGMKPRHRRSAGGTPLAGHDDRVSSSGPTALPGRADPSA